jgi:hypothetical protein
MGGRSIRNSLRSEASTIAALEYRRAVGRYVDWTVTAIDEGNAAEQAQRRGHAAVADPFTEPEDGAGHGRGLVLQRQSAGRPQARSHKAGLVSVAGRYHLSKRVVGV